MPQRDRTTRKDSSNPCCLLSAADIPWFSNFGKFVDKADFLLDKRNRDYRAAEPIHIRKLCIDNVSAGSNPRRPRKNEPNSVKTAREKGKRADKPLRAHGGPRIVSEIPRPVSRNEQFSRDRPKLKGNSPEPIDGSGSSAPTSLGEILRRMISFDASGRDLAVSRRRMQSDMEFKHFVNNSRTQDQSGIKEVSPSSPDGKCSSHFCDTDMSEKLASEIDHSPSQDSDEGSYNADVSQEKERRKGEESQSTKLTQVSARNLGAMMRRMISFERHSKSPSRA